MDDVRALLETLKTGTPLEQRTAALRLGVMRNPLLAPDLIQAADTPDANLRTFIASALAVSAPPSAVAPALRHHSEPVRLVAVAALQHMGHPEAVPLLAACLQDTSVTVQQAAAHALLAYDTDDAHHALKNWNPEDPT
jgi:HEAT repeat protein